MASKPANPDKLLAGMADQTKGLPPVERWNPPFCGDIDIRIARDGQWYYLKSPMTRQGMVKLFSSILRLDDDDCYYLVTPVEKVRIQVDDAPFVAHSLQHEGEGEQQKIWLTTNVDESILLDQDHPLRVKTNPETGEPAPYVLVRRNLEALVQRAAFYEMVQLAEMREDLVEGAVLGIWSCGHFFYLGSAET